MFLFISAIAVITKIDQAPFCRHHVFFAVVMSYTAKCFNAGPTSVPGTITTSYAKREKLHEDKNCVYMNEYVWREN